MRLKQKDPEQRNRFDLEQDIISVWQSIDDIKILYENLLYKQKEMTVDEVANALLGIHLLLNMKCEKLFSTFEEIVHNGRQAGSSEF